MSLDARRLRAWQALELGPIWQVRPDRALPGAPQDAPMPPPTESMPSASEVLPDRVDDGGGPAVAPPEEHRSAPDRIEVDLGHHAAFATMPRIPIARSDDWTTLRSAVEACEACGLSRSRRNVVFGSGSETARWLLVGEAPGRDEDASGEPFVGQAGRLLDRMLQAVGLDRTTDVYIANTLKCRPPDNRNPEPGEVAACSRHLAAQIRLLKPDIVLALGRFSAQALLNTDASISSLRGKVHRWQFEGRDVPLVCTYHPAYLLRTPADKRKVWEDLCLAQDAFRATGAAAGDGQPDAGGQAER